MRTTQIVVAIAAAISYTTAQGVSNAADSARSACERPELSFQENIDACNRRIATGQVSGRELSILLRDLAVAQLNHYRANIWKGGHQDPASREKEREMLKQVLEDAISVFTKSFQNDQSYAEALVGRAAAYEEKYDRLKVVEDYDLILQMQPKNAKVRLARGRALYFLRQYAKAVDDYDQFINLGTNEPEAYVWRGEAWRGLENDENAMRDFDMAIKISPHYFIAFEQRAAIFEKRGLTDLALSDLSAAIEFSIPEENYRTYERRGDLFLGRHDYGRAIEDYTRAIKRNLIFPQYSYLKRADAYMAAGELDSALLDYDNANLTFMRTEAKFLRARVKRALAREQKGDRYGALQDYQAALALTPKDDDDRKALAVAQDRIKDF